MPDSLPALQALRCALDAAASALSNACAVLDDFIAAATETPASPSIYDLAEQPAVALPPPKAKRRLASAPPPATSPLLATQVTRETGPEAQPPAEPDLFAAEAQTLPPVQVPASDVGGPSTPFVKCASEGCGSPVYGGGPRGNGRCALCVAGAEKGARGRRARMEG